MFTPEQISQIQQQLTQLHKTNEQNRQRRAVKEEQIRSAVATLSEKGILSCAVDAPLTDILAAVETSLSQYQGTLQSYADTASKVLQAVSVHDYATAETLLSSALGTPVADSAPQKTAQNASSAPVTPAPMSDVASAPVAPQNAPNAPILAQSVPSAPVVSLDVPITQAVQDVPTPQPVSKGTFDLNSILNQAGFQS